VLFKRQQLLLTLLETLQTPVGKTDFQKLLFLFTKEFETVPSYEFVPYRFGCFSFTASADHARLVETGHLEKDEQQWRLTEAGRQVGRKFSATLPQWRFKRRYEHLRGDALIAQVYRNYPYYAIRSEIAARVLSATEMRDLVGKAKPAFPGPGLLTIGYEGRSLEGYLNALLQAGVTVLCDVRRNPLSRKYGFSKSTLSHACAGVGLEYQHLPQLGIASEERQELNCPADYDALFEVYERTTLPLQEQALTLIKNWIGTENKRVALTCYERLPEQCHRHCVAEAVERAGGGSIKAIHL
jgi:hypothetical protein